MKIIADLPEKLISQVRDLIYRGRYSSISSFLLTATENQLALETTSKDDSYTSQVISDKDNNTSNLRQFPHPTDDINVLKTPPQKDYENIWDLWLWGQINRVLPIKFATRYLAIITSSKGELPELREFGERVSQSARNFGNQLIIQDKRLDIPRDKKLSTGFPTGDNSEKSQDRYMSQFVGYRKSDGEKTGALFDLKFANLLETDNERIKIGLTSEGKSFSELNNPVIDNKNYSSSLSKQEIHYYLNHIKRNIPGEVSLLKLILTYISRGIVKRDDMNNTLKKFVEGSNWSEGLVSTQRSGAISRMYELGLIAKEKIGLEVRYQITSTGINFLKEISD